MTKLNNKGVALIVAVVTTVIFLMLVVTVVVVSMSTYKKSGQGHDRAMALNLAEAGINDALYRMNYLHYGSLINYPDDGYYLNPSTTLCWSDITTLPTESSRLNNPFGVGSGNGYIVQFFAHGADPDELRSTAIYNGKRRVVSVNIRGINTLAALNTPTHGIAEAFNKHAVYANTVIIIGTPAITGNIACVTEPAPPGVNCTVTKITPATLFEVPDSTVLTTLPVPTYTYTDGDRTGGTFPGDGFGSYAAGTYIFTGPTLDAGNNLNFLTDTFVPMVNINNLTTINSSIQTDGALTLSNSKIIGSGVVFQPAGGITISSGITITGDLIVSGTPIILNGVITVDGNVLCDNNITVGNIGGMVTINGLLYTSSASATAVTIGNTSTDDVIIIGTVVASGTVTLNLCTIIWDKNPFIVSVGSMYDDFFFGRRVYLPVPGSWREE